MMNPTRMAMKKVPPPNPAPCNIETTDDCDTTIPMVIMNNGIKPNTFFSPMLDSTFSPIKSN